MKGAQELLVGEAIRAGCTVTPKGRAKGLMAGGVAGELLGSAGRVAGQMAGEASGKGTSPLFANVFSLGYLVVAGSTLVLLEAKQGLLSPKASAVLARESCSMVTSATLGEGRLQRPLTVTFTGGLTWEFEVPRVQVKGAEELLALLSPRG